ncbi:MAG: peptidoglycan-binding protein [Chryseobacterium sp.]|nr:MAG: peptidoglycan-binding protein [Chryseobacterium sp.]
MQNSIKIITAIFTCVISVAGFSQHIENAEKLRMFTDKLKSDQSVTNILFLGDSHIQSGWITDVLRKKFQSRYGNAGRGLVFPYSIANSNGEQDYTSVSNQAWVTFRSVYDQDIYREIGALGFVMGNRKDSFIEIDFNDDSAVFDRVKIFGSETMNGDPFRIYESEIPLSQFVKKKKEIVNYVVEEGETYPELAAKFNTITTRLLQLNGESIKNPKAGQKIKAEQVTPEYNADFESKLKLIGTGTYTRDETVFNFPKLTKQFVLRTDAAKGNVLYGFQFLNSQAKKGVVLNSVGINGATYTDYLKYPVQVKELKNTNPDLLIVSLGTNEALSAISKENFQASIKNLIDAFRSSNPNLPVLLIAPTDNNLKPDKTKTIVTWIQEAATINNAAFLDQYEATGGRGYFQKALLRKVASGDGVHFQKEGYVEQGELIWKAFENSKIADR